MGRGGGEVGRGCGKVDGGCGKVTRDHGEVGGSCGKVDRGCGEVGGGGGKWMGDTLGDWHLRRENGGGWAVFGCLVRSRRRGKRQKSLFFSVK